MLKLIIIPILLTLNLLSNDKNLQKVSLQLHWKYQFEFAGFIAAVEKGFYKDVGLDVELKEFNFGQNIIEDITNKKSTYGIYNSNILLEYLNNKPIKLLSSYFKRSALVLITKPEITYPKDLINKKIMAAGLKDFDLNFNYIFSLQNIDTKKLNLLPHTFNIKDFAEGKVDAMTAFISDQPYKLNKLGVKYNIINPSDYGLFNLQLELFTSQYEEENYRVRTQKFKEASLKGWEYALNNQDEVIDIILKKYNTQNLTKDFLENEATYTQRLIMPKMYEIGSIDEMYLYRQIDVLSNKKYLSIEEKKNLIENFIFYSQEELDNKTIQVNLDLIKKATPFIILIIVLILYRQRFLIKYNEKLKSEVLEKTNEYKIKNQELADSNENFNYLIDTVIEAIVILDKNYNIIRINKSAKDILFLEDDFIKAQTNISKFINEKQFKKILENLNSKTPFELEINNSAKEQLPALICAKRIIRGVENYTIITIVDLTQIKIRDEFIQQQAKFAQMGELLSMIAHQWRQPLTAISATSESLKLKAMLNQLSPNEVTTSMNEIYTFTSHLSHTINDFRDFYSNDKVLETCTLKKLVTNSLNIIEESLKYQNITIEKEFNSDAKIQTYTNEIRQVILSLLQNAEEVLLSKKIKNPTIKIETYENEKTMAIKISDNGGGIEKTILSKIFEPYFSTKKGKNGTGLGLYFSKRIIENNCNGLLLAQNNRNGAVFTIEFNKID